MGLFKLVKQQFDQQPEPGQEEPTSGENGFHPVTTVPRWEYVPARDPMSGEVNFRRVYYPVPESLRWAMPGCTSWKLDIEAFKRERKRLHLMAETLIYGIRELEATYGVWDIYNHFRGRLSLHGTGEMARLMQSAGILVMPPQENRPRWINVPKAYRFIRAVNQWVNSEPMVEGSHAPTEEPTATPE